VGDDNALGKSLYRKDIFVCFEKVFSSSFLRFEGQQQQAKKIVKTMTSFRRWYIRN
jgi:hypothetical protein